MVKCRDCANFKFGRCSLVKWDKDAERACSPFKKKPKPKPKKEKQPKKQKTEKEKAE